MLQEGEFQAGSQFENESASDAAETATAEGRGFEASVADDEDVAACAFTKLAVLVGEEALAGAV